MKRFCLALAVVFFALAISGSPAFAQQPAYSQQQIHVQPTSVTLAYFPGCTSGIQALVWRGDDGGWQPAGSRVCVLQVLSDRPADIWVQYSTSNGIAPTVQTLPPYSEQTSLANSLVFGLPKSWATTDASFAIGILKVYNGSPWYSLESDVPNPLR